jgi:UDP-N-acetylmuramoyl-tripeptide--D-alanyl-D-alanine ligase
MDSLLAAVTHNVTPFQSVVVKGSRFMKMERVVEALLQCGPKNNNKWEAHAA